MRIDLHLHSTASDGSLTPGALVAAARVSGLDVIALTDHDTVAGIVEARRAGEGNVHVIAGIEVSTRYEDGDIHVLGYYIDPAAPRIVDYVRRAGERRRHRMSAMIERLDALGAAVAYDAVVAVAGPEAASLGRPHLARALVDAGHAASHAEAFDRYIGDGGPAFVPIELLSPEQAIAMIHDAGGVAVWAHPRPDRFVDSIDRFVDWGLDGVECFRPRCPPTECLVFETAAIERALLVTGGSDWHGVWNGKLGEFAMARDEIAAFLERGGL